MHRLGLHTQHSEKQTAEQRQLYRRVKWMNTGRESDNNVREGVEVTDNMPQVFIQQMVRTSTEG